MDQSIEVMMADPDFRAGYTEWRANPFTKRMMDIAREASKPVGLGQIVGDAALYVLGICTGATKIVSLLEHLDLWVADGRPAGAPDPVESYGLEQYMLAEGYTPERVRKIIEETKKQNRGKEGVA